MTHDHPEKTVRAQSAGVSLHRMSLGYRQAVAAALFRVVHPPGRGPKDGSMLGAEK